MIEVVALRLDRPEDDATDRLDAAERARAAAFVFERDRRRYVAAHAGLRRVLGDRLGCPPASLQFAAGSHGKPFVSAPACDLRFNLSHAGERGLIALARGREVGVDIEAHKPIDVVDLARRVFAPGEVRALEALDARAREAAFYRCWTRKEAFIKALGEGLRFPLDGFEVDVVDDLAPQLLRACPAAPDALARWRLVSLTADAGYTAALCAEAGDWRIVQTLA